MEASSCAMSGLGPAVGASPLCCCSVGCEAGTGAVPTAGIAGCSAVGILVALSLIHI